MYIEALLQNMTGLKNSSMSCKLSMIQEFWYKGERKGSGSMGEVWYKGMVQTCDMNE